MRTLGRSPGQCRLLTWHLLSLKSGSVPCCVTYIRGTFRAIHSIGERGGGGVILPIYHPIIVTKARVSWYPLLVLTRMRGPSCEILNGSSCARRVSRLQPPNYSVTCPKTIPNIPMADHRGHGPQKRSSTHAQQALGEGAVQGLGMIGFAAVISLATQATVWYTRNRVAAHVQGGDWMSALGVRFGRHTHHVASHCTIETPSFRQPGSFGKSRQLCYFVITPVQTRGTSVRRGHSQRGLPAYRNVESLDSCQRLLK